MNPQEQRIQAVIQAVAQGQDVSQFDGATLSAAKQYVVGKANELNRMVNSTNLPPNVSREMVRNELTMYQGFADKLAEDDPMFGSMMDVALISAGVIGAAKYGPLALAKAKTMGESAYGFARNQVDSVKNYAGGVRSGIAGRAGAAYGAAADFASRGAEWAGQSPVVQRTAAGIGGATQYARDFGRGFGDNLRRPYPNVGDPVGMNRRLGMGIGNYTQYSPGYAAGQKTYGFGKNLASGIGRGVRRLFRIPV